jgi:hypothetical protein
MKHPNLKLCICVMATLAAFTTHEAAQATNNATGGELAGCNEANKFLQLPQVVDAMNSYIDHPKGIDMKNIKKNETSVKVSAKDEQIKKTLAANIQLKKSVSDLRASTSRFQAACQALNTGGRQGNASVNYSSAQNDLKIKIEAFNIASANLFGPDGNVQANSKNVNTYYRHRREDKIGEWGKALNRMEILGVVGNFEKYGPVKNEKFVTDFQQKVNAGLRNQILKGANSCRSSLDKLADSYSSSVNFKDDKSVLSEAKYAIANCQNESLSKADRTKDDLNEQKSSISTKSATNSGFMPSCMLVADPQPGKNCKEEQSSCTDANGNQIPGCSDRAF